MSKIIDGKCMLCGNCQFEFISNTRDYDGNYKVGKCCGCGHVQITHLPTAEEDEKFYQEDRMNRQLRPIEDKSDLELMRFYESWASYQCSYISQMISKDKSILEIGSGYGWFVKKMTDMGFNVQGLELSTSKCKLAQENLETQLINKNMLLDNDIVGLTQKFDVVVCFHVLEHIVDPVLFLERAKSFLKPGGIIYVEVPNFNDWCKKIDEGYCQFSYMRNHVSYYYPNTLTSVMEKAGFSNIKITGVQEYSFENALNWLYTSAPFKEKHQIWVPESLEWLNDYYKKTVEERLESYAILAKAVNG